MIFFGKKPKTKSCRLVSIHIILYFLEYASFLFQGSIPDTVDAMINRQTKSSRLSPRLGEKTKKSYSAPSCMNATCQVPFSNRERFLSLIIVVLVIIVVLLFVGVLNKHGNQPLEKVPKFIQSNCLPLTIMRKEIETWGASLDIVAIRSDRSLSIYSFFVIVATPMRGFINISVNATWSQNGITVAGDNRRGHELYQLSFPSGLYVDDNNTVYIADSKNNRIVKWICCVQSGYVVGGNGIGNQTDQLSNPTDVIVDRASDSLIICDEGNRRVLRWLRQCPTRGETIISNILCHGLTMDDRGFLYVSDREKHAVVRWREGDAQALVVVAGGNKQGDRINQLNTPSFIFVDRNYSLYVSDALNHRVMKWVENAKEGSVAAGGRGEGKNLTQVVYPQGVVVDQFGTVYVVDAANHRIMSYRQGKNSGRVLVDGDVAAARPSYLSHPMGLSFDVHGNLYVVDMANHRVRRYSIE